MTFFGEVVFPEGELDDDFSIKESSPFEINVDNSTVDELGPVEKLILAVNFAPCTFLRVYFSPLNQKERKFLEIFSPPRSESDNFSVDKRKPSYFLNYFYSAKEKSLLILCPKEIDERICYEIVEKIFELIKFSKDMLEICVLDQKTTVSFIGGPEIVGDQDDKAILRQINTSWVKSILSDVKELTPPNVLYGLSASIMSECEKRKIKATTLITFNRKSLIDREDIDVFKLIEKLSHFRNLVKKDDEETNRTLRTLLENQYSVYI